ncbi:MAG: hypothetical protein AABX29_06940, partial [Nanoarchaeota archaeon]
LILIVIISFLLLYGSLHTGKEDFVLGKNYKRIIGVLAFIGVVLIFAGTIRTDSGESWLEWAWDFVTNDLASGPVVSTIVFLALIVLVVWFVGWGPGSKKDGGE